ncbi:ROK family transcriptional regulator [Streptomyces alkaliterrae]|uniref:ROK family protein n=1 Tax=Streptomyces alkaliterrae TaxID=2213162 RepID=A0A5P0YL63_9ACTN|nr:ROK family transcriptional regulator [Streptomyces alkaliterrae]MBB1259629.1 ROK family transcriptional regulator [Streptomyces alkaliterrae]MQS00971.1 ROK family protein [Streptomyces alkaliterrae]
MSATTPGTPRVLRAMNDRAALELLLRHGPLSRTRLGTLTGLSKPTASQLLARLEAADLVLATGTSSGRPGPGAQLYSINPAVARVAGVDVTAARIRAAVADVTGRTVGTFELPTPGGPRQSSAAERVVAAVDGAARAAGLARADLHRVVIGTPGAFDPRTGRLRYASHLPGWHAPELLEELAAALPMPVDCENDVNLVAVAEQHGGAARGHDDFVLLWAEEGVGAALVFGGRLHRGSTGGAGEVGFLPVPGAPLVRGVARTGGGGFQELVGARALRRLAHELGLHTDPTVRDADAVAALLRRAVGSSDADADASASAELLRRAATGIATGLAAMVAVLDPELIVLSGGLHLAGGEVLREAVQRELVELAAPRPRVVLGHVTDGPVLAGALAGALITTRDEVFDTNR